MNPEHKVIFIPGLDDRVKPIARITRSWGDNGLSAEYIGMDWLNPETKLSEKLLHLSDLIARYSSSGDQVSLIGISAGGSAALNAFVENREKIYRVINVCGRLRTGPQTGFRALERRSWKSRTFFESVKLFESRESELNNQDRQKIMTIRAMFGDQLVPSDTTIVHGATNISIPTIEHVTSIYSSLTFFSSILIKFLKNNSA